MPLDTKGNFWTLKGEDGHSRSHIPPQPLWTFFIRIAQLVSRQCFFRELCDELTYCF